MNHDHDRNRDAKLVHVSPTTGSIRVHQTCRTCGAYRSVIVTKRDEVIRSDWQPAEQN